MSSLILLFGNRNNAGGSEPSLGENLFLPHYDFSSLASWTKAGLYTGIGAGELFFQIDRIGGPYGVTGVNLMTPGNNYRLICEGDSTGTLNFWTIPAGNNSSRIQIVGADAIGAGFSFDVTFTAPALHTNFYLRCIAAMACTFTKFQLYAV